MTPPAAPGAVTVPPALVGADAGAVRRFVGGLEPAQQIALISGPPPTPGRVVGLLRYNVQPFVAGNVDALGVGGIRFTDGPRGVVLPGGTSFPAAIARGAAWDPDMEERIGAAMGYEARALGANLIASVCINLPRYPGWGRTQESYGEDPVLLAALGTAAVTGIQRHAMACVKHFALNSIENSRFRVDVRCDPRTLYEVYLPHFRAAVDAGAAAMMSAYNRVNGTWCGHNRTLLTEILRDAWDFDGFVMSDFFFGVRDGVAALSAGCDLEMPFAWRGGPKLAAALAAGTLAPATLAAAAARVVGTQARFAATLPAAATYDRARVAGGAHRALAREAAIAGMVLLKNQGVLPLPADLRTLALVGPLAESANQGDKGSSGARPPEVTTVAQGLAAAVSKRTRLRVYGGADPKRAAALAGGAQAAVVVVGLDARDEGEYLGFRGGDRTNLQLPRRQAELVLRVAAANPRTTVVLIGGGALDVAAWRDAVPGILMSWYPGMEGGHAIADVLLGRAAPGGRLPLTFAAAADLPPFDPKAARVTYDALPGYRYLDVHGRKQAWAFGAGLSYGDVRLGTPRLVAAVLGPDDTVRVELAVANAGADAGWCVPQVYVGTAPRVLKAFAKARVPAGGRVTVALEFPVSALSTYDPERDLWCLTPGAYPLWVGQGNEPATLQPLTLTVRA